MASITDLAQAIIRFENVDPRYNNPGAIFDTRANRIKTYNTYGEGYSALINQINYNIGRGLTTREFFAGKPGVYPGYAPAMPGDPVHGSNNPNHYAEVVAGWLGVDPDKPLHQIIGTGGTVTNIVQQLDQRASNMFDATMSRLANVSNATNFPSLSSILSSETGLGFQGMDISTGTTKTLLIGTLVGLLVIGILKRR